VTVFYTKRRLIPSYHMVAHGHELARSQSPLAGAGYGISERGSRGRRRVAHHSPSPSASSRSV